MAAPPPNRPKVSTPPKVPRDRFATMTRSHLASDATADAAMRDLGARLVILRKKA